MFVLKAQKTHNQRTMRCAEKESLPIVGESQPLVAVGTCQSFGEDYPGTGRVLFFQITRKPAEGSEAEEQWDANMIYSRYSATPTMQGQYQATVAAALGNCCSSMAMLCVQTLSGAAPALMWCCGACMYSFKC